MNNLKKFSLLTKREKKLLKIAKAVSLIPSKHPVESSNEIIDHPPFFLVSSGRSGTTLLASLLDSHPQILVPPEQFVIHRVIAKYKLYNWMPWSDLCSILVGDFARSRTNVNWQLETAQLLTVLSELPPDKRSLRNLIDLIYRSYGDQHGRDFVMWGDKTPKNTLRISELYKLFPDAKYIALVRDGRDVVSSMLDKQGKAGDLNKACQRWLHSLEAAQWLKKNLKPDQFYFLRYEQLVSNPQDEVNALLKFLGCKQGTYPLDNRTYIESMGKVAQAKHFEKLHSPISPASVGSWKKRLNSAQMELIEEALSPALAKWGYL